MIAFIDEIALPFLQSLYAAVGYVGVMIAMAIESAMIPLPSELILPLGGFMVSDASQIEPLTGGPWNFWIVVIVATIGNTLGSLIAYAIGAWGGRPFLERYGKYMLIREHELEAADHFFARYGSATVFIGRLLPIVRTFISFPAGVARMNLGKFILYSTLGALLWSMLLVWAGAAAGRQLGDDPGHAQAVRHGDRRPGGGAVPGPAVVAAGDAGLAEEGRAGRRGITGRRARRGPRAGRVAQGARPRPAARGP